MRVLRLTVFGIATFFAGATAAPAADLVAADKPVAEVIDYYLDAKLREQGVQPAALADDANLLRRLTLDLAGRIPAPAETRAYLASTDPHKRARAVDRLMASPAFARHQVNELDAMLMAGTRASLREYLTAAAKENRPWDRVFRELLLPDEKDPKQKGAAQFFKARVQDLDRLTNDVSVLFFGVNISCAQCHDHPLVAEWKQDHFYGMKSFFHRTYQAGGFLAEHEFAPIGFRTNKGVAKQARLMFLTGKTVEAPAAKPLTPKQQQEEKKKQRQAGKGQRTPPEPPKFSGRANLVEVALKPGQRDYFARAIVNRLWHRFFGLGLVQPLDQMHPANESSHPELLQWLAHDLVAHNYDLRRLVRGLVLNKAYARSSRYPGPRTPDPKLFALARLRPLTPMQLATSLRVATADPEWLSHKHKPEEVERRQESLENQARGLAGLFEQPRDDFQIGVGEALLFSNGERIQREVLADGGDRLLGRLKGVKGPEAQAEAAVFSVLARPATDDEKKILADYLKKRPDRPAEALRQVVWALLTSSEFRFNY
jgi:hypothetical protein